MKINGRKVDKPNFELLVIPRPDGNLVFKFDAVLSEKPYFDQCPRPTPPKAKKPGGVVVEKTDDPNYRKTLEAWGENKINWTFLQSIKATEGLEWETVIDSDPGTWGNWRKDLENAHFAVMEVNLLFQAFLVANSLSQDKIDEAREAFLLEQAEAQSPPQ